MLTLVAAYGMCFGLMNDKVWFLTDRLRAIRVRVVKADDGETTLFDRMLTCTYCTGFHTGWIAWLLAAGAAGSFPSVDVVGNALGALVTAFASAAFCYTVDTAVQWLESSK